MAKTCVKQRRSGTKTRKCNKSLRLTATIRKLHLGEHELKQKEALETPKIGNTASACQENAPEYYENFDVEDANGIHRAETPYYNRTIEEEEVELRKKPNFASYQLQQWMLETSNSFITLAERLEKSKSEGEGQELEDNLCRGGDCDEDWGRKPYDWTLFSE